MAKVRFEIIKKDGQEYVEEIHRVVVYRFRISDVDDPEIYAAEPIYNWQQTDAGRFVMENAKEPPVFQQHIDHIHYGYSYTIVAELELKKLSEFYLRWGKHGNN